MEVKCFENPENLEFCLEHHALLDSLYALLEELKHIVQKHFAATGTQSKKQVENPPVFFIPSAAYPEAGHRAFEPEAP